jgi:hypothetical protein
MQLNKRQGVAVRSQPCATAAELHKWVETFCAVRMPRRAVCPNHDAPFEYLLLAYFEPARDVVVWAPRGGGKTRLGAIATLLDLLHKPGVAVRILGGSLEQSLRMWEHLLPDLASAGKDLYVPPPRSARALRLDNGSHAAVLTQSQRAVRGLRVQKLRCDEVEMFDRAVWEAAQLVTRSLTMPQGQSAPVRRFTGGPAGDGRTVRATVEAISTFHKAYGLMNDVVETAKARGTRVLHWCILDVLERCPPERDCASCDLFGDCNGIAKTRCDGFFSIDDAIAINRRSSVETWEAEMLCKRPSQQGCVFRTFDERVHVRADRVDSDPTHTRTQHLLPPAEAGPPISLALDFGYAAPFVCLWIVGGPAGDVFVVDEYVQEQRTMDEHLDHVEGRAWGKVVRVACDPAGSARNEQTAASNVQLLRSRGYRVHTRKSQIVDGLELIRAALKPAAGNPTLFIHARCGRLIKAMRSYHYPEAGGELPVKDGVHDHLVDALRYWFVNRGGREVTTRLY